MVELGYFLIDQLHFLYLSLDVNIFVLFAFDGQFEVVDHFFEFVYGEGDFLILVGNIFAFSWVREQLPSSADFCSSSRSYLFLRA